MSTFLLFESALGFALFERIKNEEIGMSLSSVQKSIDDLSLFSKMIKLKAFLPFASAEVALESITAISEGDITKNLAEFLELNVGNDKSNTLGVIDLKTGNAISETLGIKCKNDVTILEIFRGIRTHFVKFLKGINQADLTQAQLGLCHSYSRSKVKFNVHRLDSMIVQSIALLDQLDKDVNTLSMRVREWYGMHFPELARIVTDNYQYCLTANFIKDRKNFTKDKIEELGNILEDPDKAQQVFDACRISMGTTVSDADFDNINTFVVRVASLHKYRASLYNYLSKKMSTCAPNLTALIGEQLGARLISKAGSLTNLAKYPASTVQILGAEKALFRALKTKGNTPKHGLLFASSFIGRANAKLKGRISRTLANKCSIASRVDCFSDEAGDVPFYGIELRKQVEERLDFYKSGTAPRKNMDAMKAAADQLASFEATAQKRPLESEETQNKKVKSA